MATPTVKSLTARLDKAALIIKRMEQRMAKLEERDTKVRKQLWYLQKVAHGEFAIGSPQAKAA